MPCTQHSHVVGKELDKAQLVDGRDTYDARIPRGHHYKATAMVAC
jgi:hypothetical protein